MSRLQPVILLAAACWCGMTASTFSAKACDRPPNIMVILIDDLGYGDLGCTGNRDVKTPAIDRLAAQGTRFTQFYVASPICSPSRVGILTGQYPSRHLIHSFLASRQRNRDRGMRDFLDPAAPSIGRTFRAAGYATAHYGKWHMGGGRDVDDAPRPQAYGFDESLVSFEGLGDRILPPGGARRSAQLGQGNITHVEKHEMTEIYVERAINFIDRNRQRSWYLHLWPGDVHDPHEPREDALHKYSAFGANPYVPRFYAVLEELDRQLGRLVDYVDQIGLAEDTIIVLTSDNGPTAWPKYYREGHDPPGSTAGFRGRKWSLYEGGIRMPLVVRWPGHIAAGKVDERSVVASIDLFPTLCRLAGIESPQMDFDGEDMSPAFFAQPTGRAKPIFWEYGRDETYLRPGLDSDRSPQLAVREGRWKLLANADGSRVELYDLDSSVNEQENQAAAHPAVADRLLRLLFSWRRTLPTLP